MKQLPNRKETNTHAHTQHKHTNILQTIGYYLKNCSFIDNPRGSMFNGQTFTEDSYYEGDSPNIGNPWLFPASWNQTRTYGPTSQRAEALVTGHEVKKEKQRKRKRDLNENGKVNLIKINKLSFSFPFDIDL